MIKVQFMKPFYTKISGGKLRLVFAYQYFSITKDEEIFHFIPIEGKEIIIDLNSKKVKNKSEVFVFQKGNRFVRLPIHHLLSLSDFSEYLEDIVSNLELNNTTLHSEESDAVSSDDDFKENLNQLMSELALQNLMGAIDKTLEDGDKKTFEILSSKLNKLLTKV